MDDSFSPPFMTYLEQFIHVESNIVIDKSWIKNLEIRVVDILGDQSWSLGLEITTCLSLGNIYRNTPTYLRIPNNIQQGNYVGSTSKVL